MSPDSGASIIGTSIPTARRTTRCGERCRNSALSFVRKTRMPSSPAAKSGVGPDTSSAARTRRTNNNVDRDAHGGKEWYDYMLDQAKAYQDAHGVRIFD